MVVNFRLEVSDEDRARMRSARGQSGHATRKECRARLQALWDEFLDGLLVPPDEEATAVSAPPTLVEEGETCGARSGEDDVCAREPGHEGSHAAEREDEKFGTVRAVWYDTSRQVWLE